MLNALLIHFDFLSDLCNVAIARVGGLPGGWRQKLIQKREKTNEKLNMLVCPWEPSRRCGHCGITSCIDNKHNVHIRDGKSREGLSAQLRCDGTYSTSKTVEPRIRSSSIKSRFDRADFPLLLLTQAMTLVLSLYAKIFFTGPSAVIVSRTPSTRHVEDFLPSRSIFKIEDFLFKKIEEYLSRNRRIFEIVGFSKSTDFRNRTILQI